jgi:hypothetical protein
MNFRQTFKVKSAQIMKTAVARVSNFPSVLRCTMNIGPTQSNLSIKFEPTRESVVIEDQREILSFAVVMVFSQQYQLGQHQPPDQN